MMNPNNNNNNNKKNNRETTKTTTTTTTTIIAQANDDNNKKDNDNIICYSDTSNTNDMLPNVVSKDQLSLINNNNNNNNNSLQQQRRGNLVHSVSIIVEPAINTSGENDNENEFDDDELHVSPQISSERRKTIAGPISMLEDLYYDQPKKAKEYDDVVQSLFASARLRKEEFAKLLEEHDQIVKEINKAETSMI